MLHIGIISTPTCYHARAVATVINGLTRPVNDTDDAPLHAVARDSEIAELMHIIKFWQPAGMPDPPGGFDVHEFLSDFGIDELCESREQFIRGLDGVLILTSSLPNHQKYAPYFLRQGVPVFLDKPISYSPLEAEAIIEVARETGTPFMSAAASRFDPQLADLKADLDQLGQILTAWVSAPAKWGMTFYAVHGLEMLFEVLGADVVEVYNVGEPDANIVRLTYRGGLQCILQAQMPATMRFLMVVGTEGGRWVRVHDFPSFYHNMLAAIARLFKTGKCYISLDEMLKVIQVVTAAERSAILRRPLRLE